MKVEEQVKQMGAVMKAVYFCRVPDYTVSYPRGEYLLFIPMALTTSNPINSMSNLNWPLRSNSKFYNVCG
jgi:hypothetical protein